MQSRASSSSASSSSDVTISDSTHSHVKKEETQTPNSPDLGNVEKEEEKAEKPAEQAPAPYSLFTVNRVQKWTIVILASIASFISPTTGSIYLPVIPTIAHDLMKTESAITLSVTVYMILQGITPLFLGSTTDTIGRRPISLICLLVYLGATSGLANCPNSYLALMLLRCLQAAGSASLVSIAAGVVGDITQTAERGSVYGALQMANTLGAALGPLFGGLIDDGFGWRAIFWFLFIVGALSLTLILFFQPETLRKLVGNGSKPAPTVIHEAAFSLIRGSTVTQTTGQPRPGLPKDQAKAQMSFLQRTWSSIIHVFAPFALLKMPEMTLSLLGYAISYTGWYMLITSLSTVLTNTYNLSTLEIGLVYLAPGAGSGIGAFVNGRVLDRDYRKLKTKHSEKSKLEKMDGNVIGDFPLEKARLQSFPFLIVGYVISTIAYGFLVRYQIHVAGPIIFTFFSTYCQQGIMATFGTMNVDYKPSKGASATSLNNIFKCLLGAAGTAIVQPMINGIGAGFTYLIVSGFVCLTIPIVIVLLKKGGEWRRSRG